MYILLYLRGSSNIIGNTGVGTIHISTAWNVLAVYQIVKESRSTAKQVVLIPVAFSTLFYITEESHWG